MKKDINNFLYYLYPQPGMDIPKNIIFMTKAKEWLERLDIKDQDFEYQLILNHIVEYLKSNCKHNIIKDNIDITPDHNQCISYCEYCYISYN